MKNDLKEFDYFNLYDDLLKLCIDLTNQNFMLKLEIKKLKDLFNSVHGDV